MNANPSTSKTTLGEKKITCFKCGGSGHYMSDCPNKKTLFTREKRVYVVKIDGEDKEFMLSDGGILLPLEEVEETEFESEDSNDVECIEGDFEEKRSMVIRRSYHATPSEKKHEQRENIFQAKCRVKDNVCDFIIDGGSEANCVSKDLVEQLNLPTFKHPFPYRLKWLNDERGSHVKHRCLVPFSIKSYQEDVECDVMKMDACHILLGRPWQSDKDTTHRGLENSYMFIHEGKKIKWMPLPPSRAIPPSEQIVSSNGSKDSGGSDTKLKPKTALFGRKEFEKGKEVVKPWKCKIFDTLFDPPRFRPNYKSFVEDEFEHVKRKNFEEPADFLSTTKEKFSVFAPILGKVLGQNSGRIFFEEGGNAQCMVRKVQAGSVTGLCTCSTGGSNIGS